MTTKSIPTNQIINQTKSPHQIYSRGKIVTNRYKRIKIVTNRYRRVKVKYEKNNKRRLLRWLRDVNREKNKETKIYSIKKRKKIISRKSKIYIKGNTINKSNLLNNQIKYSQFRKITIYNQINIITSNNNQITNNNNQLTNNNNQKELILTNSHHIFIIIMTMMTKKLSHRRGKGLVM